MRPTMLLLLPLCIVLAAGPAAAGPLLTPADLDTSLDRLPLKVEGDPVASLRARLAQLDRHPPASAECSGLRQALAVIDLARGLRISPAGAERPLLAGL
jgi:hypothetical protein